MVTLAESRPLGRGLQYPIRVLVVDDSSIMRTGLARKIESDSRFRVVDTAFDGRDGVAKALRLKPDVVTLDVDMPNMNGIEALRAIMRDGNSAVVMVSAQTQAGAAITLEALEIGAIDFIPKARGAELIHEKLLAAAQVKRGRDAGPARAIAIRDPAPQIRPAALVRTIQARIVVIGSSTGGPQALQAVISQLPKTLPVPVVVAQHMPPHFTKALAQRLDDTCAPTVVEAQDGEPLIRGKIYIAPGGQQMRVTANEIKITESKGESLYKPSVDVLAESVRSAFGKNVLGVMLTGMGADGAQEFTKIHKAGGMILSQDQATCVVYGMPRSLVEAGGVDEVIALPAIGQRIRALIGC